MYVTNPINVVAKMKRVLVEVSVIFGIAHKALGIVSWKSMGVQHLFVDIDSARKPRADSPPPAREKSMNEFINDDLSVPSQNASSICLASRRSKD
jgi:hypothetical protein